MEIIYKDEAGVVQGSEFIGGPTVYVKGPDADGFYEALCYGFRALSRDKCAAVGFVFEQMSQEMLRRTT
jgi:hypothetical protein